MRAAVCVGDAHVRGGGAVFTSWHARGPGVGGGGDAICGLTAKQRVRVARACVWPRRRLGLRSSDSDSDSSVVRQRQGGALPGASSLALFTLPRRADLAWAHIELATFPSACLVHNYKTQYSCIPLLSPTLNYYTQLEHNMDAAIDLSDASKALDLSNIRFQLMYGPSHVFVTLC